MVRVAITGALGRMGSGILRKAYEADGVEVAAAIEVVGKAEVGQDIGELIDLGNIGVLLSSSDDLADVLRDSGTDVLIDFTATKACIETVKIAAPLGVDLVIGTTGFTPAERAEMDNIIEVAGVSAVISPNMATGVNVFFKIVQEAARIMGEETDIEIIEAHHHHKKDAPSGTAYRAGELIAEVLGRDIEKDGVFGRSKGVIGERTSKEIGFHAIRAGDIVGDHTVMFAGDGERFEITHRAHSRDCFQRGAVKAAVWLGDNKGQGKVFTMFDVLGI